MLTNNNLNISSFSFVKYSKYILIIFVLCFGAKNTHSQKITVNGKLADKKNNSAAAYATIAVKDRSHGTYSNIDGSFSLDNCKPDDIIQIRHINYEAFSFRIDTFTNNSIIQLSSKDYKIEEIVVIPGKTKIKKIGYTRGRSVYSSKLGGQFAMLLKNDKHPEAHIAEITFEIKRRTTHRNAVKIHLYENNKGRPGNDIILKNNIIIIDKIIQDKIIYKPEEKIAFPKEGLFIGYEWLGHIDNQGNLLKIEKTSKDYAGPGIKCKANKTPSMLTTVWNLPWEDMGRDYRACISVLLVQNK
jgi:hypothetical protein